MFEAALRRGRRRNGTMDGVEGAHGLVGWLERKVWETHWDEELHNESAVVGLFLEGAHMRAEWRGCRFTFSPFLLLFFLFFVEISGIRYQVEMFTSNLREGEFSTYWN